jgi:uncharacterized protein (DUF302 family)
MTNKGQPIMATTHRKQVKFSLLLPSQVYEDLEKDAKDKGLNVCAYIRQLLAAQGYQNF